MHVTHVHTYIRTLILICLNIYKNKCVHNYILTNIPTYENINKYVHVRMNSCIHRYTYINIKYVDEYVVNITSLINSYIHTYIEIYKLEYVNKEYPFITKTRMNI